MEVAADVNNVNSMLLISKGTLLAARHIRLLKTWGVESVSIVSATSSQAPAAGVEIPADIQHAAESYVTDRFSRITVMTDTMRIIKGIAVQRAAQRMFHQSLVTQPKPSVTQSKPNV